MRLEEKADQLNRPENPEIDPNGAWPRTEVDFQISGECLVGTFGYPYRKTVTLGLCLTAQRGQFQ